MPITGDHYRLFLEQLPYFARRLFSHAAPVTGNSLSANMMLYKCESSFTRHLDISL